MLNLFLALLTVDHALALSNPLKPVATDENSDIGLNVLQLIEKYGYPVEQHKSIKTEDDYLLEIHRIPHGLNNSGGTDKPVVFLMHGLLSSSADWVVMGPQKSLAYILADLGYDVWMGNARGTTWSRKHLEYNPNFDSDFWDFSWNEIGIYDLPAMIDYVLANTGEKQLFYVGHSQGATSYFVLMSTRPEYNKKIRLMMALAPAVFMSHLTNPFVRKLAAYEHVLDRLSQLFGVFEVLQTNPILNYLGQQFCNDQASLQAACANLFFLIAGFDSKQLNRTTIPVITSNAPAGASIKQLVHFGQGVNSGLFRKYDFGSKENLVQYGSVDPPQYELGNVSSNVSIFYADNDWLVAVTDVLELQSKLPNVVYSYLIPFAEFNHMDYLYAIDVVDLLYSRMISLMKSY